MSPCPAGCAVRHLAAEPSGCGRRARTPPAPMERFDEALALVCEAMGFSAVGYVRMNEGAKRDMWSMYSASLSAVDLHRMSEYGRWQPRADDELVHAVERAAFVDLRMYAQASHVFDTKVWRAASTPRVCRTTLRSVSGDAQVRSAGATFQAALKALQGKPDADGWRGDRCGHFCTTQLGHHLAGRRSRFLTASCCRPLPRYKWLAGDDAHPSAIRVLQRATGFNATAATRVWSFVPTETRPGAR
jgi:hypothetical protein